MFAAAPGSPLPLASEVVARALRSLEHEPEVAQALACCELYGKRSRTPPGSSGTFLLPLDIAVVAPVALLTKIGDPEFTGRIRQAIDSALVSPAVVAELTLWSEDTFGELAA